MKRPLCLLCLAFAAILTLCIQIMPMPVRDCDSPDGRQIAVEGVVYRKEYREREGFGEIPVIYLKSVHVLYGFGDESGDSEYSERNPSEQFPIDEIKNILCYMEKDGYKEPALGAAVRLEGKAYGFAQAGNPGEFDMQNYYRIQKLSFRLEHGRIRASGGRIWYVREGLYRLKQHFADVLENVFPSKEASLMKAMLLGEKNGLDEKTKELYQKSSIIHILSISGLHISMIGMGLYRCLRKAGLKLRLAGMASIVAVFCYGGMTGMGMSSVRAIIMFLFRILADMAGRTYDMATALALAAALLLAEQPAYIEHSGFLFSFGAVASLGVLVPVLQEGKCPVTGTGKERTGIGKLAVWKLKQALISGAAVTMGTLPVHLWFHFQFPVYSVLLNLAVIPLMAMVMGTGLFCMILGGIFPGIAKGAALMPRIILWFYEKCCLFGEKIPYGVWVSGRPEGWQAGGYLFLLILLVVYVYKTEKKPPFFWKCQWIFAALCILLLKTENGFQVTMLDVGQGECIHIRSGEGRNYLIDGGSSTKGKVMEYQILPYLKFMGISRLEAVFVTHSDSDHCGGILRLLEEYPRQSLAIGSLILPDIGRGSADEPYREIERLAREKGIRVQYMSRGQRITDGDMRLTCMHPYAGYETEEKNEYSLVLLLSYREFTGLFTGDAEGVGEDMAWEYMKESGNADEITMLKVAHHGSAYSTGTEMLETLLPRLAWISCGKNNRYGHPHEDLLERLEKTGSRIYATPEYGALTLRMRRGKIQICTFRQPSARLNAP